MKEDKKREERKKKILFKSILLVTDPPSCERTGNGKNEHDRYVGRYTHM